MPKGRPAAADRSHPANPARTARARTERASTSKRTGAFHAMPRASHHSPSTCMQVLPGFFELALNVADLLLWFAGRVYWLIYCSHEKGWLAKTLILNAD